MPAKEQKETGHFLPGVRAVLDFLRVSPQRVDTVYIQRGRRDDRAGEILDLCRAAGVRFQLLAPEELRRVYAGNCQGVAARLAGCDFCDLGETAQKAREAPLPLLLALDQILDPGNAGTLARTLYALGGGGLLVPKYQAAYLGAGAARSAAGALERLPVVKAANLGQALESLKETGFTIYGASSLSRQDAGTKTPFYNIYALKPRFPAVLALGGEEKGLRPGIARRCDTFVHIPMPGSFNSLNVAQAGAIILAFFSAAKFSGTPV